MSLTALRALALVWVVCCAALVYLSSEWLPDSVAANFGQGGKPTGFTARDTYRALMSTFVFAIPLLVYAGIVWLPRAFPRLLWLPNRDYWLSSTRRGLALNGI